MRIQAKSLKKAYKKSQFALDGINLELESPCMVGLVGPNGAGKTTLMKLLVSQLEPSSGEIWVDGVELPKQEKEFKRRLGYLPQDFGLYEELTVRQFLDYMACLKGITSRRPAIISECLEKTSLGDKTTARIKTLSGGQKQRVGIAQALLNSPEVLIVDEPTVGLDPEERIRFRNLFSRNASRQLVILSTHIIDDVESICNRLIILHKGVILFHGEPSELIRRAEGHAATIDVNPGEDEIIENHFRITSRIVTRTGARCRIVGDDFPASSKAVAPTLEDAYIYHLMKGEN